LPAQVHLKHKGIGLKSDAISKYKLIYYSPQLLPSPYENPANNNNVLPNFSEPIFSVGEKNGSIYLHTPPNEPVLEYLCLTKLYCSCLSCIFSLNIIYTTTNRVNAETVRVFIDDFNDYAPQFYAKTAPLSVNISESSRIGDSFQVLNAAAYDLDAYYNKITYYLSDHDASTETRSNLFEINQFDRQAGKDLSIILKSRLDHEVKKEYELFLIARDNGPFGGKSSWKRLKVFVQDENDNSPMCEKSLFIESVRENSLTENFMQIKATDLDSALNSMFYFTILDNVGEENEMFSINRNTGWLSVKKGL
jgi:hypothetical protein